MKFAFLTRRRRNPSSPVGNGRHGEEEEAGGEGVLLLLRPGVRRREDPGAAPEGQALQVPRLPQEALHRRRHGHPRPAGPQGVRHQGSKREAREGLHGD